jgi:hypothetical protein
MPEHGEIGRRIGGGIARWRPRAAASARSSRVIARLSVARVCVHASSSALTGDGAPPEAGASAASAVDSAIASVQPSHWLSRSDSGAAGAGTSRAARRASRRTSAGPPNAVRVGACTILPVTKTR